MSWPTKLPSPMQRTFADDLRWAAVVLVGALAGYLLFGDGDASLLVGFLVGVTVTIIGLNVARRVAHRRRESPHGHGR